MKLLTALFASIIVFYSCKKTADNTDPADVPISVDSTALIFGNVENVTESFNITYPGAWSIDIDPAETTWLEVSPMSGTGNARVTVKTIEPNSGEVDRTAVLKVSPANGSGQPVQITVKQRAYVFKLWQKLYGGSDDDNFIFVRYSYYGDEGYILIGNTKSADGDFSGHRGNTDIVVMRVNAAGEKVWQKTYGGSGDDEARAAMLTYGGGYMIVGKTTSTDGDVADGHGSDDGWILKIDEEGNIDWKKAIGTQYAESFFSVTYTHDGTYVVCGVKGTDAWIYTLDAYGEPIWEKTYGSSGNEMAISVATTYNKEIFVTGYTDGTGPDGDVPATHGGLDNWVFKVDKDGNLLWSKTFGGSGAEFPWEMKSTQADGVFITGYTTSNDGDVSGNHGGMDAWAITLDKDGNLLWASAFGGSGDDVFEHINTTSGTDHFLLAGYSNSHDGDVGENKGGTDAWFGLVNQFGDLVYHRNFGGSGNDKGSYLEGVSDFIFVGSSTSNDGDLTGWHGGSDAWIGTFKY